MGLTCKTAEIAKIFGVTDRTVRNWKAAGCPIRKVGGRGREDTYDSAEVYGWLLAEAVGDGAAKDPEIKAARLEILRAEAALRQLKLRQHEGDLVEMAEVSDALNEMFSTFKTAFSGLVPWLAGELLDLPRDGGDNLRAMYFEINERVTKFLYSSYVNIRAGLGILAGCRQNKAVRLAKECWENAFGASWRETGDVDAAEIQKRVEAVLAKSPGRRPTNEISPAM